jgi:short-subunit dehydrogenase
MKAAFSGKSVVITGASEGIGRALALELARDHPRLTLVARNRGRLESLAAECRQLGAEVCTVGADLANEQECLQAVNQALAQFGSLDILVNNAGITMWSRFDAIADFGVFEQVMRVNFLSAVHCTRAALPALKTSRGLIVAVASLAGLNGVPERTAYAASKHAMVGFFESLRIELAGSGVDVTIVAPDFVVSEIHRRAIGPGGAPLGHSPMNEPSIMTSEECARMMRRALARRQRLLITSLRGRLGRFVKPLLPRLMDRVAARAIRLRR